MMESQKAAFFCVTRRGFLLDGPGIPPTKEEGRRRICPGFRRSGSDSFDIFFPQEKKHVSWGPIIPHYTLSAFPEKEWLFKKRKFLFWTYISFLSKWSEMKRPFFCPVREGRKGGGGGRRGVIPSNQWKEEKREKKKTCFTWTLKYGKPHLWLSLSALQRRMQLDQQQSATILMMKEETTFRGKMFPMYNGPPPPPSRFPYANDGKTNGGERCASGLGKKGKWSDGKVWENSSHN